MKRKGIVTRIGSAILVAALMMTDVAPVVAAETDSNISMEQDVTATETDSDISMEQDVTGSETGVSKVIGLEGYMAYSQYWDDYMKVDPSNPDKMIYKDSSERVYKNYVYTTPNSVLCPQNTVVVYGQKDELLDEVTGLYKYGDAYYNYAKNASSSTVLLTNKVLVVYTPAAGTIWSDRAKDCPKEDETTGFITVNGKLYAGLSDNLGSVYDTAQKKTVVKKGCYFVYEANEIEYIGTITGITRNGRKLVDATYGKKIVDTDSSVRYYEANGKTYDYLYYNYDSSYAKDANGKYLKDESGYYLYNYTCYVYGYKNDQVSFDRRKHTICWSPVSNYTQVDQNGKLLKVGFQVRVNGQMVFMNGDGYNWNDDDYDNTSLGYYVTNQAFNGNEIQSFTTNSSYTNPISYAAGESAVYEVRAVYYTQNTNAVAVYKKDENGNVVYKTDDNGNATNEPVVDHYESYQENTIVKTGPWSDAYSYSYANVNKQQIPAVTGLVVNQKSQKNYELSWNSVSVASDYVIQYYAATSAIDPNTLTEKEWSTWTTVSSKKTYWDVSIDAFNEYKTVNGQELPVTNIYFRVYATVNYDDGELYDTSTRLYSEAVGIAIPADKAILPTITGLKVEKNTDGSFTLKWDKVDKDTKIRVYYSKDKSVFDTLAYTYSLANPYAQIDVNNTPDNTADDQTYNLVDAYSVQDAMKIVNKKVEYQSFTGVNEVSSDQLYYLETGIKYYFAVVTYDSSKRSVDRTAITPYKANVSEITNKPKEVSYGYYTDVTTAATTSATRTIGNINTPAITSGKTKITLTFDRSDVTGYQIYRKNSKGKYKKIATTTSVQYVDSNLKEKTTYSYKARAYKYNTSTKKTIYSDYVYFKADTSTNNYIDLKLTKTGKNSVKLKWMKVAGATKYEVYRCVTSSTGTDISKKYDMDKYNTNSYENLANSKWELIKTINNPKTVSYKDKKLTTGESYYYQVIAYYKDGKKTKKIQSDQKVISFKLEDPQNVKTSLKGSTVKVTWNKEPYAKKYEIRYRIYNSQGNAYTEEDVIKTTKKTSYSIKNVGQGDYVSIIIRATDGKKWSDFTSAKEYGKELTATKSVKVKEVTVKDAKGKSSTAVKISWKPVAGAAYYSVYRSTSPSIFYNKDKKVYSLMPGASAIAKESNDDEYYDELLYDEYKGRSNTIVGTSAVDRGQLKTGVTYYYAVCAYAADGTSISSEGYTKPASICFKATPTIKKATAKKGKNVLTIGKVSGAKKYVVYRSTKKNSGYKKIGTTSKTTYTDKKVKKGTTYYYKVVAVGTNGLKADFESNKSKAVKVKAK